MAGTEIPQDDRIAQLPLSLREYILEYIPIKEAVRTSTLSHKWRYCWNGVTTLVFDEDFQESMHDLNESKFATIINRSLTRGCIRKFVLHIPSHHEVSNLDMDAWMLNLSPNGLIQELAIHCYCDDGDLFTLPSHIYNCLRLTHLSLEGAVLIPPPNFSGFPNLVNPELKGALMSADVLGALISKCQQLEKLTLGFAHASNNRQPISH